jgi:UDP-glucuronate 4-epimerase
MKKVLVTGSCGFIGFHLSLALQKLGHFVIGYDNFNNYYDPNLKTAREAVLQKNSITTIHGDIRSKKEILSLLRDNDITNVVHLAAQAGVRYSLLHPEKYCESNLEGFIAVLEACRNYSTDVPIVFASSSSVYGTNKKTPFSCNDTTDSPANLYGATKKANELIAYSYNHIYGMAITGLRFFTVFGPWGRPDMAYYSFTKNILENTPIQLFNYGNMKRDFTYVDDIIQGILSSMDCTSDFSVYNLGNNTPIAINTLVSTLENYLNKKAIIEMLPKPKGEVISTCADIAKAKKHLNYEPTTSFQKGIKQFIEWYFDYHFKNKCFIKQNRLKAPSSH